jgi:hypothetical protein
MYERKYQSVCGEEGEGTERPRWPGVAGGGTGPLVNGAAGRCLGRSSALLLAPPSTRASLLHHALSSLHHAYLLETQASGQTSSLHKHRLVKPQREDEEEDGTSSPLSSPLSFKMTTASAPSTVADLQQQLQGWWSANKPATLVGYVVRSSFRETGEADVMDEERERGLRRASSPPLLHNRQRHFGVGERGNASS